MSYVPNKNKMAGSEKMREEELKYVLRLLDDLSANVYEVSLFQKLFDVRLAFKMYLCDL